MTEKQIWRRNQKFELNKYLKLILIFFTMFGFFAIFLMVLFGFVPLPLWTIAPFAFGMMVMLTLAIRVMCQNKWCVGCRYAPIDISQVDNKRRRKAKTIKK